MTDTPKFVPIFGRKDRQFDRLWQAVQYATGYDAQSMSIAQDPAWPNQWFELGKADAIEDAQKPVATTPMNFIPRRPAQLGKTFDQMLDEVSR